MKTRSAIVSLLFISLCICTAATPGLVAAHPHPPIPPPDPSEGEPPRPSDYCYRPSPCVCCVHFHLPGGVYVEICIEESWRPECGGDVGGVTAPPALQSIDPTLLGPVHTT